MRKLYLVFVLILCSASIYGKTIKKPDVVSEFDIRYYQPQNLGLKDLVFEARISNLVDYLNKNMNIGKILDVYFQIYWIYPGQFKIEVVGLPEGFVEIKQQLKNLIKLRLDYVIPQPLWNKLRSYDLKVKKKNKKGTEIIGKDSTYSRSINELILNFDERGRIKTFKTVSPTGINTTKMEMSSKSWSKNKWVLDKSKSVTTQGMQKTEITNVISYTVVGGIGFPKEVKSKTKQSLIGVNKKDANKNERAMESTITFSNYVVNSNRAKNAIIK